MAVSYLEGHYSLCKITSYHSCKVPTETLKQDAISPSLPGLLGLRPRASGLSLKKVPEKNSQSEL